MDLRAVESEDEVTDAEAETRAVESEVEEVRDTVVEMAVVTPGLEVAELLSLEVVLDAVCEVVPTADEMTEVVTDGGGGKTGLVVTEVGDTVGPRKPANGPWVNPLAADPA